MADFGIEHRLRLLPLKTGEKFFGRIISGNKDQKMWSRFFLISLIILLTISIISMVFIGVSVYLRRVPDGIAYRESTRV